MSCPLDMWPGPPLQRSPVACHTDLTFFDTHHQVILARTPTPSRGEARVRRSVASDLVDALDTLKLASC